MSHPDMCEVCGRYHVGVDCKKPSTNPATCDCWPDCEHYVKYTFDQEFEEKVNEIGGEIFGSKTVQRLTMTRVIEFAKWFYDMGKEG